MCAKRNQKLKLVLMDITIMESGTIVAYKQPIDKSVRADAAISYTGRMGGARRSWIATVRYYYGADPMRKREFARMCWCFMPEYKREYAYCSDSRVLRYRLGACLFGLASDGLLVKYDDATDEWLECYCTARKYIKNARNLLGGGVESIKYPQTNMWVRAINVCISMKYDNVDAIEF